MDFLRNAWAEARHRIYLWALGSLLFTAIMAAGGWGGTFSERAGAGGKRPAAASAAAPGTRKPGSGVPAEPKRTAGGAF